MPAAPAALDSAHAVTHAAPAAPADEHHGE
jgi:hypothetical protein